MTMRIIAGDAKGTKLTTPAAGTRPMTGRAKESLFSILVHHVPNARVLDLFAGSGSLGLEALSRGAASAQFVERSPDACAALARNIEACGLGGTVVRGDVASVVKRVDNEFDLVFVDPPYADTDTSVFGVLEALDGIVSHEGIVVVHRQARSELSVPDFLTCIDERRYGDAVVTMLERSMP